mmetsp:Transcript_8536/g.20672  ORF Transcript_8536/g.20672 Transcript_8536/m.20672 type:complete len:219 (+) Transcript_8536:4172-4828(+)
MSMSSQMTSRSASDLIAGSLPSSTFASGCRSTLGPRIWVSGSRTSNASADSFEVSMVLVPGTIGGAACACSAFLPADETPLMSDDGPAEEIGTTAAAPDVNAGAEPGGGGGNDVDPGIGGKSSAGDAPVRPEYKEAALPFPAEPPEPGKSSPQVPNGSCAPAEKAEVEPPSASPLFPFAFALAFDFAELVVPASVEDDEPPGAGTASQLDEPSAGHHS